VARRNDALTQLDLYRAGMGLRLRRLSDRIIEGESSVPTLEKSKGDTPSLVPSERDQR
jgi:hypothetical protein